ncbi:MAG: DUF1416 domain-containing protein [Thermoguttaceae bacterium]|nr:DUF1416 domain-containing protein [Thermoguttaceae bacterium]MDW8079150.1 hypothetical protein [Thermoguttaceae bacterium]
MRFDLCFLVIGFVILAQLTGCGGKEGGVTVSGKVTFDGKPVPQGYVTLAPADGKGPSAGGEIRDGQFTIRGVLPGEKIVSVTGGEPIQHAQSSEELAQMAARGERPKQGWTIPPNAKGNNQRVTISAEGGQTLNLELTSR